VIEKELAGPLGVVVKASTLRDYGVDNFFFLENKNTDTNQRNVVFIARGESAHNAHAIAGELHLENPVSPAGLHKPLTLPQTR
jgi:hypothetical protein